MNLLNETIEDIELSGRTPEDIIFIGSEQSGHCCTWEEFKVIADIEYSCGYGAQEIGRDLVIVFSDGAKMYRHEYDGSECWRFSLPFVMPDKKKQLLRVTNYGMWESLEEINREKENEG